MLFALIVSAAAMAPPESRTLAVFFFAEKGTSPAILRACRERVVQAGKQTAGIQELSGEELALSLGASPDAAMAKCGPNLDCLADLGERAKVDEVLIGRVVPLEGDPGGAKVQLLFVGAKSKAVLRKLKFEIRSVAGLQLEQQMQGLFGGSPPAETLVLASPPAPPPAGGGAPPAPAVAAVPQGAAPDAAPEASVRLDDVLMYGGLGSAVLGGGLAIVGVIFAAQSRAKAGSVEADTDQLRTYEIQRQANTAANRANGLLLGAGVALLSGGTALGAWWWRGRSEAMPVAVVAPTSGGAEAVVRLTW